LVSLAVSKVLMRDILENGTSKAALQKLVYLANDACAQALACHAQHPHAEPHQGDVFAIIASDRDTIKSKRYRRYYKSTVEPIGSEQHATIAL
jgi:hypothetical protein